MFDLGLKSSWWRLVQIIKSLQVLLLLFRVPELTASKLEARPSADENRRAYIKPVVAFKGKIQTTLFV